MDYTNLPLWVIRVIRQIHIALKAQGVYYFNINDDVLQVDREDDLIICIRLRHRVKICCTLPSGKTVKATIYHYSNRPPLVETEGIDLLLNRFIPVRRLS